MGSTRESGEGSKGDCHQETQFLYAAGMCSISEAGPQQLGSVPLQQYGKYQEDTSKKLLFFGVCVRSTRGKIDFFQSVQYFFCFQPPSLPWSSL